MTTVVRTAAYTFGRCAAESSPGNYLPPQRSSRAAGRQFKTSKVHSSGGIQASLLAYFAPIAKRPSRPECFHALWIISRTESDQVTGSTVLWARETHSP